MTLKVGALEDSQFSALKALILCYPFKPFQEYDIPQARLGDYVVDEIEYARKQEKGTVLACEENSKLVGFVSANRMDWDSRHFATEMARVEHLVAEGDYRASSSIKSKLLSSLLKASKVKRVQHLTATIHTEDISSIHALESQGFKLMDTRVSYALDLSKESLPEIENSCYVREFQSSDLSKLAEIAREVFRSGRMATDRFHADPSLSPKKSDELYVEWIVNSCRGLADAVFVAEVDHVLVGYITCKLFRTTSEKLGKRFGSMIISGVSPSVRQRGVYSSLFNTGLRWLAERVDIVEIGTQIGNYVVQRVWPKFGFALKRSVYTFARANIETEERTNARGKRESK